MKISCTLTLKKDDIPEKFREIIPESLETEIEVFPQMGTGENRKKVLGYYLAAAPSLHHGKYVVAKTSRGNMKTVIRFDPPGLRLTGTERTASQVVSVQEDDLLEAIGRKEEEAVEA